MANWCLRCGAHHWHGACPEDTQSVTYCTHHSTRIVATRDCVRAHPEYLRRVTAPEFSEDGVR